MQTTWLFLNQPASIEARTVSLRIKLEPLKLLSLQVSHCWSARIILSHISICLMKGPELTLQRTDLTKSTKLCRAPKPCSSSALTNLESSWWSHRTRLLRRQSALRTTWWTLSRQATQGQANTTKAVSGARRSTARAAPGTNSLRTPWCQIHPPFHLTITFMVTRRTRRVSWSGRRIAKKYMLAMAEIVLAPATMRSLMLPSKLRDLPSGFLPARSRLSFGLSKERSSVCSLALAITNPPSTVCFPCTNTNSLLSLRQGSSESPALPSTRRGILWAQTLNKVPLSRDLALIPEIRIKTPKQLYRIALAVSKTWLKVIRMMKVQAQDNTTTLRWAHSRENLSLNDSNSLAPLLNAS